MTGRKRHLATDTLGLLLAVWVHPADIQDRAGAWGVLAQLRGRFPRLATVFADQGYAGFLEEDTPQRFGWSLQITRRPERQRGFVLEPKRWIVERTFAWLMRYRRLSKDYEFLAATSEAMIRVAMINLMLHRLAPG